MLAGGMVHIRSWANTSAQDTLPVSPFLPSIQARGAESL